MATTTRIDYKRELRELYAAGREPVIVDVPEPDYGVLPLQGLWWTANMSTFTAEGEVRVVLGHDDSGYSAPLGDLHAALYICTMAGSCRGAGAGQ